MKLFRFKERKESFGKLLAPKAKLSRRMLNRQKMKTQIRNKTLSLTSRDRELYREKKKAKTKEKK